MRNRDLERKHYPTTAALYALERAAKEARAAEIARLVRAGMSRVKTLFSAVETTKTTKGLQHA